MSALSPAVYNFNYVISFTQSEIDRLSLPPDVINLIYQYLGIYHRQTWQAQIDQVHQEYHRRVKMFSKKSHSFHVNTVGIFFYKYPKTILPNLDQTSFFYHTSMYKIYNYRHLSASRNVEPYVIVYESICNPMIYLSRYDVETIMTMFSGDEDHIITQAGTYECMLPDRY